MYFFAASIVKKHPFSTDLFSVQEWGEFEALSCFFPPRGGSMRMKRKERGAALVEYALLVALLAVVCIGSVRSVGSRASDSLQSACSALGGSHGAGPTDCTSTTSPTGD